MQINQTQKPEWTMRAICHGCDAHVQVKANHETLARKSCPVCRQTGWLESE